MNPTLLFAICLLLPFIWFRTLFYTYNKYFKISTIRKKTKLQIHHLHYGLIILTLASFLILFTGENYYVIGLLGFGLGFALDEFIPALLMPGNRPIELKAYGEGFKPTLILLIILILLLLSITLL
ncbi:MAG: hypothetical protein KKB31_02830 [Nanoarchaeota archaeon]|nr:hypothetical protein [Nanoarchaeota archaeon]